MLFGRLKPVVWCFALLIALTPASGKAQDLAALIADRVSIGPDQQLIAQGNIEVIFKDARLTAQQIIFEPDDETLTITGPITLIEADGTTAFFADSAELSRDMRRGILRSARLVLDRQLQIAAVEINRVGGRYTQLYKTVASSCQVCAAQPVPLWQIRAERIIHDEDARQLYFHNARFEVAGVPVLYLPRMRFPDPTLERATGFLTPSFRSTDALGFGIKTPYFFRLGDHADLTLTPYISADETRTLEARYRQVFRTGRIELNMAASRDDIRPDETRSYLFATGRFDLPRDYVLSFNLQTVSDSAYLLDYDYSDLDRLQSNLRLARTGRDLNFSAGLTGYRSLRDSESNETTPTIVGDIFWERRFRPALIGGTGGLTLAAHSHYRRSGLDVDGPDADSVVDGRDVTRLSAQLDWRRDWQLSHGILGAAMTQFSLDNTFVEDDAAYPESEFFVTTLGAVELRWPFVKNTPVAAYVIEPVVQLVWSGDTGATLPDDESALLEFDEGNLFSFNRFPGGDRYEQGVRANIGLSFTRQAATGLSVGATVGRILRVSDSGQFAGYEALDGKNSHWMAAVQAQLPGRLSLMNRALFDQELNFERNELRFDWLNETLELGGSYIWIKSNVAESRPSDVSELRMQAAYRVSDSWQSTLDYRYDFQQSRAASARLGLQYRNECVTVDLSLSRRFTSSTTILPTTDFGLTVSLAGFGANEDDRPRRRRACSG
jgi:LPS-assembly protein